VKLTAMRCPSGHAIRGMRRCRASYRRAAVARVANSRSSTDVMARPPRPSIARTGPSGRVPRSIRRRNSMASRDGAIGRAVEFFDGVGFRELLAALVAIPSTSQDPAHLPDVERYLG